MMKTTTERVVRARGLELHTRRGQVYPPTSLDIAEGSVTALLGPARSGRTAMLLTLAGRMRPTSGAARVCGHDIGRDARRVRATVGLGLVASVNDLDDALTCAEHLIERALLSGGRLRIDVNAALETVGLTGTCDTRIGDLDTEGCMRLGIALALVGDPQLIAIDDVDHDLELHQQAAVVALLREVAQAGTTVFFTCVDERTAALADATIVLPPAHVVTEEVLPDEVA